VGSGNLRALKQHDKQTTERIRRAITEGYTMLNTMKKSALVLALVWAGSVVAQPPGNNAPRTPTPRLPDGTVDLSGDDVWNLSWITDVARQMPNYKDGDLPPMLPWTRAMWEYNKSNNVKYDPQGFCLIPGGPRSMGTPYPAEIIQHRDRIIIIFEG